MWFLLLVAASLVLFPKKALFWLRVSYIFLYYPVFVTFIRFWTKVDIQSRWTSHGTWACNLDIQKLEGSVEPVRDRRTLLMGNHRNFVDFVTHDVITEFTACYLSRALVGIIFPLLGFFSWYENRCWYFVRGKNQDLEIFYKWLDSKFEAEKVRNSLIVYPEGHRNLLDKPLPLKTGMIRYAYQRQFPIQMFMCTGYDFVINEKLFVAEWGKTTYKYKIYPAVDPKDFETPQEFVAEIRKLFEERFYEVRKS